MLYRLALRRDSDAARMQASVKAFEAAREVLDRDEAPDRWAEITNQMGVALLALGSQVTGTEALERSVAAFREALEVRRRDVAPLLWAQTANNLGAASFALSRRKSVPGLLDEAVRCFEGAREIYVKYRQPKVVTVIEKKLAKVRERLGKGDGRSPAAPSVRAGSDRTDATAHPPPRPSPIKGEGADRDEAAPARSLADPVDRWPLIAAKETAGPEGPAVRPIAPNPTGGSGDSR